MHIGRIYVPETEIGTVNILRPSITVTQSTLSARFNPISHKHTRLIIQSEQGRSQMTIYSTCQHHWACVRQARYLIGLSSIRLLDSRLGHERSCQKQWDKTEFRLTVTNYNKGKAYTSFNQHVTNCCVKILPIFFGIYTNPSVLNVSGEIARYFRNPATIDQWISFVTCHLWLLKNVFFFKSHSQKGSSNLVIFSTSFNILNLNYLIFQNYSYFYWFLQRPWNHNIF